MHPVSSSPFPSFSRARSAHLVLAAALALALPAGLNAQAPAAKPHSVSEKTSTAFQQLKPLQEKAKKPLSDSIADLDKKAAELEGPSGGYGAVFLRDAAGRSLARLSGGLNQLLGAVDGADAEPTSQQIAMLNQVQAALEQQLADWKELKDRELPALNSQLRRAKLNEIIIKK